MAYLDQHSANESAATTEQQTYANKLTFWFTDSGNTTILNVQNASTDPASDVEIVVEAKDGSESRVDHYPLGTLPPCTVGSWSLASDTAFDIQTLSGGGGSWGAWGPVTIPSGAIDAGNGTFAGIAFTDANAVTWQRPSPAHPTRPTRPLPGLEPDLAG